jgi:hypothetical protein
MTTVQRLPVRFVQMRLPVTGGESSAGTSRLGVSGFFPIKPEGPRSLGIVGRFERSGLRWLFEGCLPTLASIPPIDGFRKLLEPIRSGVDSRDGDPAYDGDEGFEGRHSATNSVTDGPKISQLWARRIGLKTTCIGGNLRRAFYMLLQAPIGPYGRDYPPVPENGSMACVATPSRAIVAVGSDSFVSVRTLCYRR